MDKANKKPKNKSINPTPLNAKIENKELKMYGYSLDKSHPFRKLSDKPKKINFENKLIKGNKDKKKDKK
tara:strand:- start:432 stop:638 length:207 start_codon:yes stop_codon:yes gene_type:complete